MRNRCTLTAEVGEWIPHCVEQDEHRPDVVSLRDRQEAIHSIEESNRILLPEEIVQEHPHGVEPEGFGPAELAIDGARIEGVSLPHLQLIDGGAWREVAADQPTGRLTPLDRTLLWPDRPALRSRITQARLRPLRGKTRYSAERERNKNECREALPR